MLMACRDTASHRNRYNTGMLTVRSGLMELKKHVWIFHRINPLHHEKLSLTVANALEFLLQFECKDKAGCGVGDWHILEIMWTAHTL